MIKIDKVIIVEGKYDKIKLASIIDAVIIETDGFALFNDKEKQRLIRRLAQKKGILILTDSDSAGFKIRSFIRGMVPAEQITNAYIPDVFGKEKRKTEMSKEGKLGVEGIKPEIIMEALQKAGVFCQTVAYTEKRAITKIDLYDDGLTGKENSDALRKKLLRYLDLPEKLSTNSLVEMLNTFLSYEEYKNAVKEITNG